MDDTSVISEKRTASLFIMILTNGIKTSKERTTSIQRVLVFRVRLATWLIVMYQDPYHTPYHTPFPNRPYHT